MIVNCIEEFIEFNDVRSSFFDLFKTNKNFINKRYDLIIDLQKVVLRTLNLKKYHIINFLARQQIFYFLILKMIINIYLKIYILKNYILIFLISFQINILMKYLILTLRII